MQCADTFELCAEGLAKLTHAVVVVVKTIVAVVRFVSAFVK